MRKNISKFIMPLSSIAAFVISYALLFSLTSIFIRQQVFTSLRAISIQKSYQGLILDTSGVAPIIINLIESDKRFFIVDIFIGNKNSQSLKRNFLKGSDPHYLEEGWINSIKIDQEMDGIKIGLTVLMSNFIIGSIFLFSLIFSILTIGIFYLFKSLRKRKEQSRLGDMAKQVAHDIRSPLASLMMATRDIQNIPEEKRIIIRGSINRIQDIANDLLAKNRPNMDLKIEAKEGMDNQLVPSILEGIITEKRMQYRSKINIRIELKLDNSCYGLFAKINSKEFKRVISNLINNGVEALGDDGTIQVNLVDLNTEFMEICIADNGKGIPPETLKKLGQQGETFGKARGNGLGLYHAKKSVEFWGGKLNIESTVNVGTKLIVLLPKSEPPEWFVSKIPLRPHSEVVILDDDAGIHQIWDAKFAEIKIEDHDIKVHHITTPKGMVDCANEIRSKGDTPALYLCDFELLGFEKNGLDIIEELNLNKNALLVSSRYAEEKVKNRAEKLKVKMIPKMIAELIPLEIEKVDSISSSVVAPTITPSPIYEALYLEDDYYLRLGWERSAKKKDVKLVTISRPDEFYPNEKVLSKELTEIYIDSNLGPGEMKGEEFALILHKLGYKKIYMASGYDANKFAHLPWLKCVGKDSPWEEEF